MKSRLVASLAVLLSLVVQRPLAQTPAPQLGKNTIAEVVAAMTTEEKAKLLVGMGMDLGIPGVSLISEDDQKIPEKVPGAAGRTHAIPRLGIPSLTLSDGPAGIRISPTRNGNTSKTYYATGFPIATLVASSWDTNLANRVGTAMGSEARDYGVDILLAPAMNIHRNPLGGRNFEYYSEDPLLSGKMAAVLCVGYSRMESEPPSNTSRQTTQEFNRMQSDSVVSERALREIYLKGLEIAVKESQPWTVMSSYNLINGTYASHSADLLTTLLRGEWGFKGFVMTDWFGGSNVIAQMKAGNEMIMPGVPPQVPEIVNAVNTGTLSKEVLDQNVTRVLNIILHAPTFKGLKYSDQADLKTDAEIARETATEGMVLLKNDNKALPLAAPVKIGLFGISAYDLTAGGTGSGDVNKKYVVSLDQGLAQAGFGLDQTLKTTYTDYLVQQKATRKRPGPFMPFPPIPEMPVAAERIAQMANQMDLAVITLGRSSGEFVDRVVENDFTVTASERGLVESVTSAFQAKGKKVVVVLNVGGPIEMASWRTLPDAVLLAWQPGQEGGNAITDVLTGKVNPSGRLPMTFPIAYGGMSHRPNVSRKSFSRQTKHGLPTRLLVSHLKPFTTRGIYVGYRYYNTFGVKTAYDFGYGLSYTKFSYGNLKLSSNTFAGKVTATISVTNAGDVAGKEVVQLYLGAPRQKLSKPERELRGFAKTRLLKPGESETLTFTIAPQDLASFDSSSSSWVAEAGSYNVMVGASIQDIKTTATFKLASDLTVSKSQKLLAPTVTINELSSSK
uniref:Beta-glucosidase Lfa2 n=1 Tax=uncultured Pyrinomonas sp. TaxID=1562568 RepID=A0A346A5N9_9BACT|nr:beta-glucosidase Lfa2 [uncultured Pyrinomonas sp.]